MNTDLENKSSKHSKNNRFPLYSLFVSLVLLLAIQACAQEEKSAGKSEENSKPSVEKSVASLPYGFKQVNENLALAGQPDPDQLQNFATLGYTHIVNLRTPGEMSFDEKSMVESMGMKYQMISIGGAGDLNTNNAEALKSVINEPNVKVLVHCRSGHRVGQLMELVNKLP